MPFMLMTAATVGTTALIAYITTAVTATTVVAGGATYLVMKDKANKRENELLQRLGDEAEERSLARTGAVALVVDATARSHAAITNDVNGVIEQMEEGCETLGNEAAQLSKSNQQLSELSKLFEQIGESVDEATLTLVIEAQNKLKNLALSLKELADVVSTLEASSESLQETVLAHRKTQEELRAQALLAQQPSPAPRGAEAEIHRLKQALEESQNTFAQIITRVTAAESQNRSLKAENNSLKQQLADAVQKREEKLAAEETRGSSPRFF